MNTATWPDWIRRALRTFLQAFLGTLLLLFMQAKFASDELPTLSFLEHIVLAALLAGTVALVSALQNMLEDTTSFPALMKAPPSRGKHPT